MKGGVRQEKAAAQRVLVAFLSNYPIDGRIELFVRGVPSGVI
jgi:hypothetical protein